MRKLLLYLSFPILSWMLLSCGGRSNKQAELLTFDAYDFIADYSYRPQWFTVSNNIQQSSNDLKSTYGFSFKGWNNSGQYTVGTWVKDCDFDVQTEGVSNTSNSSQLIRAVCDASNPERCIMVHQYAFSTEEADKIRTELLNASKGFEAYKQEDGSIIYENTFMGVIERNTEIDGLKTIHFASTEFSADEDYPFKKSMSLSQIGSLSKNEFKFIKDYSSQRIKFMGEVTEISEMMGKITYEFENDDYTIWAQFENSEEAFTDLSLPVFLTLSGYVSDVSSTSSYASFITLNDVRIWLNGANRYVGVTPVDALINADSYSNSEELHFIGYLTNGSKKYNIEMVLTITNGYEVDGYYRYTSQSADKRIPLNGYVQQSTGAFTDITQLDLYSGEGTELFSISLESDWSKGDGDWYKYPTAEDCEMAGDNYTSHLSIWIMADNDEDFPH